MRIVFMGTPDIAAASLRALLEAGHEVCGVFTRQDKPVGRKQILTAPPVKQLAEKAGIPVYQPRTLRDGQALDILRGLAPQLIVVVAYGRILPPDILSLPPYGCINLHVSLLPKYRGSAPVQWAVLNGDRETGVTIMQMDEGVDTGDILAVTRVSIGENETAGELFERVSAVGAKTLCRTVEDIAAGGLQPQKQCHQDATQAPPLTKEMGCFTFHEDARHLHNLVRGLSPWPNACFFYQDKQIKVLRTTLCENQTADLPAPGTVLALKPLTVACIGGALCLQQVVPQGSRPMEGAAWAMGCRLAVGDCLDG